MFGPLIINIPTGEFVSDGAVGTVFLPSVPLSVCTCVHGRLRLTQKLRLQCGVRCSSPIGTARPFERLIDPCTVKPRKQHVSIPDDVKRSF